MNRRRALLINVLLAGLALVLVLGAIPAHAANANLRPSISPGPVNHREELRATVNARAKITQVELRVDGKKVQPWVKGHAGLKYTIRYPLARLSVGTHTAKLKVWDQQKRSTQRQWQFQKLAQLALGADRSSVQPGETVSLTGQGFTPGAAITIGLGGPNTGVGGNYGSATASSTGAFSLPVHLDRYPDGSPLHAGSITLVAHTSDGSEKASVEVRVLPAPRLALDKSSIKPGEQVRVSGEGFTPGVAVSISLGALNAGAGGNYGSAVTDSTGAFSLNVRPAQFPDGSPLFAGPLVLVAHTADSAEKATAPLQILADPAITLNKTAIKAGDRVTVSGHGFTPGAAVAIALGGVSPAAGGNYGNAVVDGHGRFSVEVLLDRYPDGTVVRPGTLVLLAHTHDFADKASAQLSVQAAPALTVSKSVIRVGEWVILNGAGFTPGKTVTIRLAEIDLGHGDRYGTAAIDANGRFSTQLFLGRYPDGTPLPPGGITLMATTADGEQALVGLQLVADPAIALNKTGIKPGDQVVVSGQGFTPGAAISISMGPLDGGTGGNYGTAFADTNGRFSLAVTLARYPDGSALRPGTIVLVAHTADFSQKASAQLQVLASPAIVVNKTSIRPGEQVLVTGQGFTPGTPVTISIGGGNIAVGGNYGTTLTDGNGRFGLVLTPNRYPNGLALTAGRIVLVAHNASWSEAASASILVVNPVPAAPGDLRIISVTKGATSAQPTVARLQWRDASANETGFRIQATFTRQFGGEDTQVWTVPGNATTAPVSFDAGGINPVTRACFTVTAFNAQGTSPPSNEVCAVL